MQNDATNEPCTTDPYTRARYFFELLAHAPGLFATTHEAFLNAVCSPLWVLVPTFKTLEFCVQHSKTYGCAYLDLDEKPTDEWAFNVIADALKILDDHYKT